MIIDDDNDPTSDFGKIDLVSADDDPTTPDNETTRALEGCAPGVKWTGTTAAHVTDNEACGGTDGAGGAAVTVTTISTPNPDGVADNMTGAQADEAECTMEGDDANACDAELVMDFDIRLEDGTFGCITTRSVTVTCTWDSTADTGIDNDVTGGDANEFSAVHAVVGASCKVEAN